MLSKNRECWADVVLPASLTVNPANTGRPINVALMLANRLWRYYDASPTSNQHWSNFPCLLGKRRRHTGLDLVCVQEIGLHSLPRILFQYQTTRDHSYTGDVAGTSGGNLGTAQQILPLKNQHGHQPRKGEMPACPALLKQDRPP